MVRVTVLAGLVFPTATMPKLKPVPESVTGAMPVPLRLTVCGLLVAVSVKLRVPVAGPVALGVNVTPTVQLAPPARLDPQVLLAMAKPAVVTMLEKPREAIWWLVRVTVLAELVLPTTTVPKLKPVLESVAGALPAPVRLTV